jgi:uncharacterized protein YjiS (DUF1127 family)
MSALPAYQPDPAARNPAQGTFRDPRQAILFFGHLLEKQGLADVPAAANEPYRSSLANTWRRGMAAGVRPFGRLVSGFLTWRDRAAARRHLVSMDAHLLRDIGLSKSDVLRESTKSFWQS